MRERDRARRNAKRIKRQTDRCTLLKRYAEHREPNLQNVSGSPADELAKMLEAGARLYDEETEALKQRLARARAINPLSLSEKEKAIWALLRAKD
jgi:hypothetical protein